MFCHPRVSIPKQTMGKFDDGSYIDYVCCPPPLNRRTATILPSCAVSNSQSPSCIDSPPSRQKHMEGKENMGAISRMSVLSWLCGVYMLK